MAKGDRVRRFKLERVARMSSKALLQLEALQTRNTDPLRVNADLYRLMYQEDLYITAYEKIKSAPGNMTPGVDGSTLDGFSLDVIHGITKAMRDESFQFKPAKRTYIPKPNGKMRPLGIPSPRDKIVQEVIHMILRAIYDSPKGPTFLDYSHGFRPNRSTHTALREFRGKWPGIIWIVEGDIKACFDEIDHHVLIDLLRKRIKDDRFINLIWKALRAGYLWRKTLAEPVIGTPQGSVCSPILANIYLHELDRFVESLRQKYEKGERRRRSKEYACLQERKRRARKRSEGIMTDEVREIIKQMRAIPSSDTEDPTYVRIRYIRYADDWVLGVIGPKNLAEKIKDEIQAFLRDTLKLELSQEKTKITHAKTEEANFLGTRLQVGEICSEPKIIVKKTKTRRVKARCTGWNPTLKAPTEKLVERLHQRGFCDNNGVSQSKMLWTPLEVQHIIDLFSSVNRGLLGYYRFVDNFASMGRIQYILHSSLVKTLAHKLQRSAKQLFSEHGRNMTFDVVRADGKVKTTSFAANTDWTRKPDAFNVDEEQSDPLEQHIRLRTRSHLGLPCIICDHQDGVQMHHVRHVRKMGEKVKGFTKLMMLQNRKQVPVCEECHQKIHSGEYDGLKLTDLQYRVGP